MDSSSETIRVIGAGLGRTGTFSLEGALERLLGPPFMAAWHAMVRTVNDAR